MRLDKRELKDMSFNDMKDTMEELKNCVNCKHFSWEEYEEGVKMYCVFFNNPSLKQDFDYCGLWENCGWATNEEMTDWFAKQFPKIQKVFKQLGVEE